MRRSLIAEGCRDDLIRWKGHQCLVEGFHRLELCRELGTSYRIKDKEFADREAVKAWIVQNQTGRRNLSAEGMSYFRGLRYQAEKMSHGGARPRSHSTYQSDRLDTAQRLAQEFGVGPATIYRDGKFAKAVDAIARNCGLEIKPRMLARDTGLKRGAVRRLAKMDPGEQRDAIRQWLETGKLPKRALGGKHATFTLPSEPNSLARKLFEHLGAKRSAEVVSALVKLGAGRAERRKAKGERKMPQGRIVKPGAGYPLGPRRRGADH